MRFVVWASTCSSRRSASEQKPACPRLYNERVEHRRAHRPPARGSGPCPKHRRSHLLSWKRWIASIVKVDSAPWRRPASIMMNPRVLTRPALITWSGSTSNLSSTAIRQEYISLWSARGGREAVSLAVAQPATNGFVLRRSRWRQLTMTSRRNVSSSLDTGIRWLSLRELQCTQKNYGVQKEFSWKRFEDCVRS
jgi:hypothetical protein